MELLLNQNELGRCYILNEKALIWVNMTYIPKIDFFVNKFQINRNDCSIDFQNKKLSVKVQDSADEELFSKLFDFPITDSIGSVVSISLSDNDILSIINELDRVKDEILSRIKFYQENI